MRHPFQLIPTGQGKWLFSSTFSLYAILQIVFVLFDAPLRTAPAPNGIVSFELAGNPATARAIIDSWNEFARLAASFGLGLDYLFMLAYSTMIGLACIWAAHGIGAQGWRLASLGAMLAWGLWLAVLFDAAENAALLVQLFGGVSEPYPQIAAWCAASKFLLIAAGLLYTVCGAAARLHGRRWLTARV